MTQVFRIAYDNQPAVIFFDDFDATFGEEARKGRNTTNASLQGLIKTLLTDLANKSCRVVLIAATNNVWDFSQSMKSHFVSLEIGLLDRKELEEMFRFHISGVHNDIKAEEWAYLADIAFRKGFTGRDIATTKYTVYAALDEAAEEFKFCRWVSLHTIYLFVTNWHQTQVRDFVSWVQCGPNDPGAKLRADTDCEALDIVHRPAVLNDILDAMAEVEVDHETSKA